MLINLQFLRLVAALLVALHHASPLVAATTEKPGWLFVMAGINGFAGVDLFFVISGFIMAWTTRDAAGMSDAMDFAKRRVSRIYSGYWPFFLLTWLLFLGLDHPALDRVHFASSMLLWPTPIENLLFLVSWTLIFEMTFYAVYAVLIASTSRRREQAMWILGAMILGWVLYARFVRQVYELERVASISVYELYLLSPLVLEFFAGALLACFLIRNPAGRSWAWLLLGLLLFFVGGWLYRLRFIGLLELGFFNLWRPMVFGMGSVLIVAGLVQLERRGFRAPLQLSLLGGGASYALYLCHTQWLYISNRFGFGEWLSGGPPWLVQLAFLGLVFLIVVYSVLHWRWVERPLHRLFRRLLRA